MLLYDTLERFEKKFGYLKKKGLRINGLKMVDPKRKKHVIDVSRPLVFDNRLLPKTFEGLDVKAIIHGDLPMEFNIDRTKPDWQKMHYIWAPERFEHFVDRCSLEIKKQLGNPAMSRDEMLSALCFGDYEAHKLKTQQMITEGKLPAYGKN
ncbi:MAG TPA: hypothetical protein PKK99_10960 [Bacteroidia bacterium]|nr:hypothetical protein [Bacteroidia bacterium]HNP99567.1 hypothetical protein [Bacteroidia bacterium]